MVNPRICGMSYEQASRYADGLIKKAAASGSWHGIVDDLVELKRIMIVQRGAKETAE